MKTLLLVEDDRDVVALVKQGLQNKYQIIAAQDLESARSKLSENEIDLIILDEELPDGTGIDFCSYLKTDNINGHIPIIFLTGHKDLQKKLMAFNVGADDFVGKPFEVLELSARVTARLKNNQTEVLKYGNIVMDFNKMSLRIINDDSTENIDLTPVEFKILGTLLRRPNIVFSRDMLLDKIWQIDNVVGPRTIDHHVSKIRKKLSNSNIMIKSSRSIGYYIELYKQEAA